MAFPWIMESNFEAGTNAEWTTESDSDGVLDFPHYSTLANLTGKGPATPYRGAYCMRVALAGGTARTMVNSTTLTQADTVTQWYSFNLYISPDFAGTVTDIFNIFESQSTAVTTVEAAISLQVTASTNVVNIGVGQTVAASFAANTVLSKGVWHHVEIRFVLQTGGTGTIDLFIDGGASAQAITTLTNIAAVTGSLGVTNQLATTTGTLLFDNFRVDDLRIYPFKERFPYTTQLTKDGHVFVGPGWIDSAFLLQGATAVLYDTDTANVNNAEAVVDLNSSRPGMEGGAEFKRGCYADLSASTKLEVRLSTGATFAGQYGPKTYGSDGNMRLYGSRRKPRAQNV